MYLKGYYIHVSGTGEILDLRKWDFGGDKPWTNSVWNDEVKAIKEIQQKDYPIKIEDLDDKNIQVKTIHNQEELSLWFKEKFH